MKKVAAVLLITLFSACKKQPLQLTDAIITGPDLRACVCCGGLMISFTGETLPYAGSYLHIRNVADLGLTEKDTFPLPVRVAWQKDTTNTCQYIVITKLEK